MDLLAHLRDSKQPPIVVAELSGNHGGHLDKAIELVDRAAESGADAIKLQTYKPETITVEGRDERFLLKEGLWAGKYLSELYAEAMTPWEWHAPLAERSARHGLPLFSSPFDESAVDFLEETLDPQFYKIASFELNHFPMLKKIARTGKTVLASTGVSSDEEIEQALKELRDHGCPEIVLLHCVSEYPAKPEDFHLINMPRLGKDMGPPTASPIIPWATPSLSRPPFLEPGSSRSTLLSTAKKTRLTEPSPCFPLNSVK